MLVSHLEDKFVVNGELKTAFHYLLPAFTRMDKLPQVQKLTKYYGDLCSDSILEAEYHLWCKHSKTIDPKAEVLEVLEKCNRMFLPNIHKLLSIIAALPVTTCSAERSVSTMKRVKTIPRNTMTDKRLSSLMLLSVHWAIDINPEEVIDIMASRRRLRLLV